MKTVLLFTLLPALAFGAGPLHFASDWTSKEGLDFLNTASTEEIVAASDAVAKASVTPAPAERDIYVTLRKDGATGSGTLSDPYDGSTEAKFDAVLASLMTMDASIHTNLHLAAGTYTVTPPRQIATAANPGAYCPNLPANISLLGAGENKTIIRAGVVSVPHATYWVLFSFGNAGGAFFKQLTVDCNIQNQVTPYVTIDGIGYINFYGGPTQSGAEYVHVMNGGAGPGNAGASEWFGIAMADNVPASNATAIHCTIDHYWGNVGCTALFASSMIAYNSVTLNNNDCYNFAGVPGGGGGAYQNAYSPSRKVLHNVCHNCTIGMYSDIGQPDSMDIEDNWFSVLYQDICLTGSGAPITNVTLRGNVFVETYGQALTLGTSNTPQVANITISNNRFVLDYKPNSDKRLLVLANASDVSVMDNVVQTTAPGLGQYIAGTTSNTDLSTVVWKNNRYRGGPQISPLPGMATN